MSCGGRYALYWGWGSSCRYGKGFYEVTASVGTFGCAGAPGRIVTCAWDVSFVSFARPWDTGVSITGTVSGDNPCGPSVCDAIVLRPALGLS